jgi:hypothetical protein
MKRVYVLVALGVAGFTLVVAGAMGAGGADIATGHGTAVACPQGPPPPPGLPSCALSTRDFTFAAVSALNGGRAGGTYRHTDVAGRFIRGRVTCVTAVGNTAVIGGVIEERIGVPGDMPPPGATNFAVWVVDNDVVGSTDVPDQLSPFFNLLPEQLPQEDGQCLLPPVSPSGYLTVVDGDIRVRDGQLAGGL